MSAPEELDLGGDVKLLLGQEGSQVRVHAGRQLLSFASDYFKTLFGPRFTEGASATQGDDVVLMDDDREAMVLLLKLLHFRYDLVASPNSNELVALAIAADKYGCTGSLNLPSALLLSQAPCQDQHWAVRELAVAAYLFKHREQFQKHTEALVMGCTGDLATFAMSKTGKFLPASAWLTLAGRRSMILDKLLLGINQLRRIPCDESCARAETWAAELAIHLRDLGVDGMSADWSISVILEYLAKVEFPGVDWGTNTCWQSHLDFDECDTARQEIIWELRDSFKGLCLDCVRAGEDVMEVEFCKHARQSENGA